MEFPRLDEMEESGRSWSLVRLESETIAVRALAHEHETGAVVFEKLHRAKKRVPSAVKSEIASMDRDERKTAANFLRDGIGCSE